MTLNLDTYNLITAVSQNSRCDVIQYSIMLIRIKRTGLLFTYRVGQIKRGQLTFLLVTSERIYKN